MLFRFKPENVSLKWCFLSWTYGGDGGKVKSDHAFVALKVEHGYCDYNLLCVNPFLLCVNPFYCKLIRLFFFGSNKNFRLSQLVSLEKVIFNEVPNKYYLSGWNVAAYFWAISKGLFSSIIT